MRKCLARKRNSISVIYLLMEVSSKSTNPEWLLVRHGNNSGSVSGSAPVLQCPTKHNCLSPAGQLWWLRGRERQNKWTRERWTALCPSMTPFHITITGVTKAPPSGQTREDRLVFCVLHLPRSPALLCYRPQWWSSPWNQHLDNKEQAQEKKTNNNFRSALFFPQCLGLMLFYPLLCCVFTLLSDGACTWIKHNSVFNLSLTPEKRLKGCCFTVTHSPIIKKTSCPPPFQQINLLYCLCVASGWHILLGSGIHWQT